MSTRSCIARPSSLSFCNWFFYRFVGCLLEMLRTVRIGGNLLRSSRCGKVLGNGFSSSPLSEECDRCLLDFQFLCAACDLSHDKRNAPTTPFRSECFWNPDAKTVYVRTFGCSHNISDGETMKGVLAQGGYNITTNKEEADVWYSTRSI